MLLTFVFPDNSHHAGRHHRKCISDPILHLWHATNKQQYGTFLLFGSCCVIMGVYTVFCVPETKGVPLESMHILFEGSIVAGCVKDTFPATSRAKKIRDTHFADEVEDVDGGPVKRKRSVEHVESA